MVWRKRLLVVYSFFFVRGFITLVERQLIYNKLADNVESVYSTHSFTVLQRNLH